MLKKTVDIVRSGFNYETWNYSLSLNRKKMRKIRLKKTCVATVLSQAHYSKD